MYLCLCLCFCVCVPVSVFVCACKRVPVFMCVFLQAFVPVCSGFVGAWVLDERVRRSAGARLRGRVSAMRDNVCVRVRDTVTCVCACVCALTRVLRESAAPAKEQIKTIHFAQLRY
jgi:hypothetical protein